MKKIMFAKYVLMLATISFAATPVMAERGWIDVHFHIVGDKGEAASGYEQAAEKALKIMDRQRMERILVMSPPRPFQNYDIDELIPLQKKYAPRIAVLGGGGTLNPMMQKHGHTDAVPDDIMKNFEAIAERIMASGAKGFGEIAVHHVSLNPGHGYESVPADNPLMRRLADIAARHDVPIDVHFDPIPEDMNTPSNLTSPKNPPKFARNIDGFARLLEYNRKTKIVWAHAGSDPVGFHTPKLVRTLLEKHPNLYCSIRTTHKDNQPMRHPKRGINREWINLVKDFPDRFVMGTDTFVLTPGYSGPDGPRQFEGHSHMQHEGANEVLHHLGEEVARKVGRENAIRLYKLDGQ